LQHFTIAAVIAENQDSQRDKELLERASTAKKPHRMDPVVRAAFAGVILERRLELNLSQKEVAERSGYSEEYIGKLERREHTPSLTAAITISTGLEKDPTDTLNDVRAKMLLFKWLEGKDPEAADY
jgi:ribosome-binding protein aMBF1 (putative translation factor)